jgi:hypothetical protein
MNDTTFTPWTPEQVESLKRRQISPDLHPYTCRIDSSHPLLMPTVNGWVCWGTCLYVQDWAHTVDVQGDD